MKNYSLGLASLIAALSPAGAASAQVIYSNGSPDSNPALATSLTSYSGINAPAASTWSETQGTALDVNMLTGFSCYAEGSTVGTADSFRVADGFEVTSPFGWHLDSVTFYIYQPGYTGTAPPVTSANMRVWDGPPSAVGATILFGDTTTSRLLSTTRTSTYRIFNSRPLPTAMAPNSSRRVWAMTINLDGNLYPPGTYWFDIQVISANPDAAIFCVPASSPGSRGVSGADALALVSTGFMPAWTPLIDGGKPALSLDAPQDLAFIINGDVVQTGCPADFNLDGGVDGSDVEDFFISWSGGEVRADVNADGGIDGSDVGVFFIAWEQGGC